MSKAEYPEWSEIKQDLLGGQNVPMISPDTPTFMRRPYAHNPDELETADVAIIGAPYVAHDDTGNYQGIDVEEWIAAPKRVRQQSAKYGSGRVTAFDVDVFEELNVMDFGDADIPQNILEKAPPNVKDVLDAQKAVEKKVNQALDRDCIPIVIGQNSPASSYGVSKPILERTNGEVGMISLDTHWDARDIDGLTMDDRIAGGGSWKTKMYQWHDNASRENLVEIGERGYGDVLDDRSWLTESNFYSAWDLKNDGVEYICEELGQAYKNTEAVYLHFDMDVMGGGGSASGDLLGGLAEPMGMSDYELLKISHEIGQKGFDALSFLCITPQSPVMYRTVVYAIMYLLAGKVMSERK